MNTRAMKTHSIARSIHAGVLAFVVLVLVLVVGVGVGVGICGERLVVTWLVIVVAVEED